MSRKYKIRDQDKLYFVTFTVIYWLDVFTRQIYRDIFLDSLRYCPEAQRFGSMCLLCYAEPCSFDHCQKQRAVVGEHYQGYQKIYIGKDIESNWG